MDDRCRCGHDVEADLLTLCGCEGLKPLGTEADPEYVDEASEARRSATERLLVRFGVGMVIAWIMFAVYIMAR
jgi:hypothetical protein